MSVVYSKTNLPKQLFINNEYVDSKNPRKWSLFNPTDGSLVCHDAPVAGEEDVNLAVSYAENAFPTWRKMAPTERRKILLRFADLVEANAKVLGDLTRVTLGSPVGFNDFEASHAADGLRYYAGWIDKFGGESFPQDDGFLKIVRNEPLGVTVGIVPWNGPLITVGLKAAPALASGNCFIFKPSEKTPFAAIALGTLIKAAGFPPGVFQVLPGDGTTGALLSSHMRVRKVSFTGSIATGKKIQEMAAKSNLKRVTLELGGKSPAVVFKDCDLENAVNWTANGITANTGQVCFASSRVYVQEEIYDTFIQKYIEKMKEKRTKIGDPEASATEIGPMVDEVQFKRVSGFIERAQAGNQGKLIVGGQRIGDKVWTCRYVESVVLDFPS